MTRRKAQNWFSAGMDAWTLGFEASQVIGLRAAKIVLGGPEAERETRLMISEKVSSLFELQTAMFTGGLGATPAAATRKVLSHYQRKVRANRRRLG